MADVQALQSPTRTRLLGGRYLRALSPQEMPRAGESPLAPKQGKRRPPAQDLPWLPSNQADKEITPNRPQGLIRRFSEGEGQKFLF